MFCDFYWQSFCFEPCQNRVKRAQISIGGKSFFNSAELIKLRALVRETTQKPRFETNYVDNKLNGRAADFPTEKAIKPRLPDSD